ncbi:NAD-dependent epimerase/dehydratase family protein [Pigmentiphaga litoralis]|uniref:dTDP-L-rhamnose 4-epimerase n=1 Tax=Pigmentiphaga litoralis TaxID=516702 RepID=A0A7Y9ISC5_9BURK|nr:NAD-dependent epimerase/dehydratase family protein [Pigmentiphaga litoralis]NYE24226.1 dTDP-L-rhamnose 4-epimerase [Pigmentiphaga litoralis]NYE82160.1 dTDP-L-rhamnose 4-epimerase [Pigmentiphaga litoralis]
MNVLITGGAGFIGSNLALHLISLGHSITVLDNLSPQIHGDNAKDKSELFLTIRDKVRFIEGSVTDEQAWIQAMDGQHAIVHLAAETGTGQSMYEIKKYVDVNIGGTALMLDLLTNTKHSVSRVVVASSRSIYGEGKYRTADGSFVYPGARTNDALSKGIFEHVDSTTGEPLTLVATDEDAKLHPSSVYGITKLNQEQMVLTVCSSLGIAGTALRYQNVYGPGQSLSNPYTGILSIFSTRIKNGNPISIFEDGLESRDFVFISDVVKATTLALLRDGTSTEVYGIGSGIATTVKEVADRLIAAYGTPVPVTTTGAYRLGDIRHNFADLEKARSQLGFVPEVSFEQGISEFTKWVNKQEVQVDKYEASIEEMKAKGLFKG